MILEPLQHLLKRRALCSLDSRIFVVPDNCESFVERSARMLARRFLETEGLTMWNSRVDLDLMLDIDLGHVILARRAHIIREERVVLHADQADRSLQPLKVVSRHQRRVRQRPGLDVRPIRLRSSLLIRRLLRSSTEQTPTAGLDLPLRREEQDVSTAKAVSRRVDPAAVAHGVGELVLGAVKDLVQDGQDLLLGVAREPHVDHEALDALDGLDLEVVEEGAALGRLLLVDGGRVGGDVALEQVGHDDDEALAREPVGLNLVVCGLHSRAARQQEQQAGGRVGVVGRLGDVGLWRGASSLVHWSSDCSLGRRSGQATHINVAQLPDLSCRAWAAGWWHPTLAFGSWQGFFRRGGRRTSGPVCHAIIAHLGLGC